MRVKIKASLHIKDNSIQKDSKFLVKVPKESLVSSFLLDLRRLVLQKEVSQEDILSEELSLDQFTVPPSQVSYLRHTYTFFLFLSYSNTFFFLSSLENISPS